MVILMILRDRWGTFDGKYFKRIETVELFQGQISTSEAQKEHLIGNRDVVVSSPLLNLKTAFVDVEASTLVDFDKVQETSFE